jgi:hypothetical protein
MIAVFSMYMPGYLEGWRMTEEEFWDEIAEPDSGNVTD